MKKTNIAVVGGDIRMYYAGMGLRSENTRIYYYGFERIGIISDNLPDIKECDCILLPVPLTRDGKTLFAPLSDKKISTETDLPEIVNSKTVFCCMKNTLDRFCGIDNGAAVYDYYASNEFAEKNAVLTADAAVSLIHTTLNCSLVNKKVLILGYGRVGKECARAVKEDFADIYAGVRRQEVAENVLSAGHTPVDIKSLDTLERYDVIINTVPYTLLDKKALDGINKSTLIIDLASDGGGTDFKYAEQIGIKAIYAPGLPGKYYPEKAGRIISQTILEMTGGL